MKILIAEDDPVSRRLLEVKLVKWGYDVVVTKDGEEALASLNAENAPRIAILDWMMPGLDGIDVCKKIRAQGGSLYTYMILLTALQQDSDLVTGMDAGADDYITKPFKFHELAARLNAGKRIIDLQSDLLEARESLDKAFTRLKLTQTKMLQREKMASIGQLAAGVAHEINNPIGFIKSNLSTLGKYAERLTEYFNAQAEVIGATGKTAELESLNNKFKLQHILGDLPLLVEESMDGANRVVKIVNNLRIFSRLDEADNKYVDINECIESTLAMICSDLHSGVELKKEYGQVAEIMCNPAEIDQMLLNLVANAIHAVEGAGTVTVRSMEQDGFVRVEICDTGYGIPEEIRERVFEPFFTTNEVGKGAGLGLSMSYEIVKKHGGEIMVDSVVGVGTTITVLLPLLKQA